MIFRELNPGNEAESFGDDVNGVRYIAGAANVTTRFTGNTISRLTDAPDPPNNLYTVVEDPRPTPAYNSLTGATYVFQGTQGDPAATFAETKDFTPWPIEDVRSAKMDDLENKRQEVAFSACDLTGNGGGDNWALIKSERARAHFSALSFFFDRDGDIAGDSAAGSTDQGIIGAILRSTNLAELQANVGAIKPRWPPGRTATVTLRHKTNGSEIAYNVSDIAPWGQLHKDSGLFDDQTDAATLDAEQDITTESDQAALEAIDIDSYPWPPYWPDTGGGVTRTVGR